MTFKPLVLAATLAIATTGAAAASAFWPGTVIGIASWDSLNVRAWPSSASRVIDTYDNGDRVSLTGRCKNTTTGISFRIDAGGSARWNYSRMAAPSVWCQVMAPSVQVGWVRGKFVWPQ